MQGYVKDDLRRLDIPPAELLSRKPMNDPLEQIMLMTSVGVPSVIYDTLKDLRLARAYRLGAMQRKFPSLGIARPARCSAWPWPWPQPGRTALASCSLGLVLAPQLALPPTPAGTLASPLSPLAGRLARRDPRRGQRRRGQPGPGSPLWAASDAPRPRLGRRCCSTCWRRSSCSPSRYLAQDSLTRTSRARASSRCSHSSSPASPARTSSYCASSRSCGRAPAASSTSTRCCSRWPSASRRSWRRA
eukprot:scaffold86991_cov70-Phaeocystis_antarctica.AAC.4